MKKTHHQKGFTLIELLVVIAVIAILSSIVYASMSSAREKAAVAKSSEEIRQIKTALELANVSNDGYPVQLNLSTPIEQGSSLFDNILSPHIKTPPTVSHLIGPEDLEERNYYYISNGQSPADSNGNVYTSGADDEGYLVMYKKKVTTQTRIYFTHDGGMVDEFGNKVVARVDGDDIIPLMWTNPEDVNFDPTQFLWGDMSCYVMQWDPYLTSQQVCEQEHPGECEGGCYTYWEYRVSLISPYSEIGYYVTQ